PVARLLSLGLSVAKAQSGERLLSVALGDPFDAPRFVPDGFSNLNPRPVRCDRRASSSTVAAHVHHGPRRLARVELCLVSLDDLVEMFREHEAVVMSDPSPFEYVQHDDMLTIINAGNEHMHLQNIVMDGTGWRSDTTYMDELYGREMWLENGASYDF